MKELIHTFERFSTKNHTLTLPKTIFPLFITLDSSLTGMVSDFVQMNYYTIVDVIPYNT